MALKTTLTPAEHANVVQGLTRPLTLSGNVAGAMSTGTKGQMLVDAPMAIRNLRARLGVCGSADATVVEVKKNGAVVASVTIDNTDPDPTQLVGLPASDALASCEPGDLIEIAVSAIGTGSTDLVATAHIDRRFA